MFDKGQSLENEFESEQALACYELAMKKAKTENNDDLFVRALEASAYVLMELEKDEEARSRLKRVISLDPNGGSHQKYMFLAQLSEGMDAVNLYKSGIELIKKCRLNEADKAVECNKQEADAYCAVADLYMTDLCDEADAESVCLDCITKACAVDPENAQAWFTAASFHTVKAQQDKSRECVEKCLALMNPKIEAALEDQAKKESESEQEEEGGQIDLEDVTGIPLASLIALTRIMIELQMWQKAADLLEVMLEEEEDNVEIYYLLVEVGKELKWMESDPDAMREYASNCKIMSAQLGDTQLAEEMEELLKQLPEPAQSIDGDDNEELQLDCSSSDDEQMELT
ncbi:hypothetical protein Ciccas_008606 [Cichlidogyrus casuarinus]|uniref:Assembly chaperone of rpl4 n=1 Tax=Cichlidogyrus casuarinus TaxID=1844966 RepID=A0ABD2PZU9_9PLAT